MKGVEQSVASGNMGIENLKNPWVPNFKGIPAKMMDPAVGAGVLPLPPFHNTPSSFY
ncbi:hypothetical protein AALP_AAs61611U000100 [Arabis alpina]|uniref:Uncharacterized protein n=1 Tax=Arabis alpina TaxID=50452 RepID=A0A087G1G4_ARAAL|nr:hypothetical protein AALP_AAs61611U000100 [Arabis alpina]